MLLSNKKEYSKDIFQNTDVPQKQVAQRKKKDMNNTILLLLCKILENCNICSCN